MHAQGHGMIPNFISTCHFCGIDGHIRPNCFHYIKMRRVKSMIEKKKSRAKMHVLRNDRTNLHDPWTSRAQVPITTRKDVFHLSGLEETLISTMLLKLS